MHTHNVARRVFYGLMGRPHRWRLYHTNTDDIQCQCGDYYIYTVHAHGRVFLLKRVDTYIYTCQRRRRCARFMLSAIRLIRFLRFLCVCAAKFFKTVCIARA